MSVGRNKFSRISANTRQLIIDEYLQGEVTQRELGEKYDFHYRRIATWFKEAGRYDEYLAVAKKNIHRFAKKPMGRAKLDVSGFKALAWRGRRLETKQGRISAIQILMPDHPFCNAQGYVYEHRIVMEEQLGRYLTDDELVHHVDLDPTNNVPENLVVLNGTSEHGRLHLLLQLALVELLEQEDLRNLTEYLVEQIRNNEDWKPAKPAKTKHECKLSKRSKDADVD